MSAIVRRIGIALISFVGVTAVFTGAVLLDAKRTRERAEGFLREATTLQLETDHTAQVNSLLKKYAANVIIKNCEDTGCTYSFEFANRWFYRLQLAPWTQLTCTLYLVQDKLQSRYCQLSTGDTSASCHALVWEQSHWKSSPEAFRVDQTWSGGPWRVQVKLTPEASASQREAAYALNLGCLSKIGGCTNAKQLLPTIEWNQ